MDTNTLLNAILALMVAERDGTEGRTTERILADAGLGDDHVAALTGRDPVPLHRPPTTAFGHAALRRAAVTARAGRGSPGR